MPSRLRIPVEQGFREVVCGDVATIGRVQPNDIVVPDPKVSRSHAIVRMLGDGRFYVMDVGSANGTFVNGERICVPRELRHGDEIRIGDQVLTFQADVQEPAARIAGPADVSSETVLTMSGVVCFLTVLIVDVRGYTVLSEHLPPEHLASVMGALFNDATHVVQSHGGVVDKFIGDGVMARWTGERNHAGIGPLCALRAACDLHRAVARINMGRPDLPMPLRIGCGINSGQAVLGTVGANARREYTAIGDAINLAFHLETATKQLGTDIAVGFDCCRHLPEDLWRGRLKPAVVKGDRDPIDVWPLSFEDLEALLARLD